VTSAWKTLRSTETFACLRLEQFVAETKPSVDARAEISRPKATMIVAVDQRERADAVSPAPIQLVVNSVHGGAEGGENGEFYETMGYVRKSERGSGLTRGATAAAKTNSAK
jgi:hypothetical protein